MLKQISNHNDVIAAMINDPMEYHLNAGMIIGDGTQQVNLGELNDAQKKRYASKQEEKLTEFKEALIRYRITPLEINTDEPVLSQIRKLLGGRR